MIPEVLASLAAAQSSDEATVALLGAIGFHSANSKSRRSIDIDDYPSLVNWMNEGGLHRFMVECGSMKGEEGITGNDII